MTIKCANCQQALSRSYDDDRKLANFIRRPWYRDRDRTAHMAIACLRCGTVHDCSESLLRTLTATFTKQRLRVHRTISPDGLVRAVMQRADNPDLEARDIVIKQLGIKPDVLDALVERELIGPAFTGRLEDILAPEEERLPPRRRQAIISAYAEVLHRRASDVGREGDLPHSKNLIRQAIREAVLEGADAHDLDALKVGYMELETFISDTDYKLVARFDGLFDNLKDKTDGYWNKAGFDQLVDQVSASGDDASRIRDGVARRMRSRRDELRRLVAVTRKKAAPDFTPVADESDFSAFSDVSEVDLSGIPGMTEVPSEPSGT